MDDRRGSYHSHRERLELNELWPSLIPGLWSMGVVHPQCTVRSPTRTSRPYLHFKAQEGVVKTLKHRGDTIVSDEREEFEEKSHVKEALTMNGYPKWLINIPTIKPSLESTTSVSSDDDQENEIEKTNKKPTSKKSPVVLPYIKGVSEQIRECLNNMTSWLTSIL